MIKGNESHVGNIQFWFFNNNHLPIKNATFWSKPHLNRTSGCRDMDNSVKFKNNVKHKNLSHLLACNSKSIFPTSDSFSLIMSHIYRSVGKMPIEIKIVCHTQKVKIMFSCLEKPSIMPSHVKKLVSFGKGFYCST